LKVKCTQYEICSQAAFKNARAMFFLKLGGAGNNFRSDYKKIQGGGKMFARGRPPLRFETPISSWGGGFKIYQS
jgi:hypothetical protein